MTKKQAAERKASWHRALAEGRVLRFVSVDVKLGEQYLFVAYPSAAQAERTMLVQQARIAADDSLYVSVNIAPAVG